MMTMPEQYRDVGYRHPVGGITAPPGSPYGLFRIPSPKVNSKIILRCLASDGDMRWGDDRWEHVSVSCEGRKKRLPTWDEMCFVKDVFWDKEDCVVQFHPPESQYVNIAEVLHLWKPAYSEIKLPPDFMV